LPEALRGAERLVERSLAAGDTAYSLAAYDTAMAHLTLGHVLQSAGAAEAALAPFTEARRRFQILANSGDTDAAQMAAVAISEKADCLTDLGRLDEAAAAYEEAIRRAGQSDDRRAIAVSKGQLGTVRMLQQRYDQALEAHREARTIFESLSEPRSVAVAWHQI